MPLSRPATPSPRPRAVAGWLTVVAVMVFLMVVVGGITRLTESGLSMVRWEPISGAIPPLNDAEWQAEFDHYRATPQYQQVNTGMSLAEFKNIFFWEYVHRLLGRLIGLVFALPLLWFWWKRAIPAGYGWKLGGILALGGLQGAIGWWMVASGLIDVPEVSHIRLAVHLLTALLIFAATVWVAMDLKRLAVDAASAPVKMPLLGIWALCLLFLQFLFGAYVAGLDAGYAFNTWPRMGEEWFPSETPMLEPFLRNFADNPIVVQFIHRWLAFVVAGVAIWLGVKTWAIRLRTDAGLLWGAVVAQILLGILTILSGVQIDIAVAHQGMAVLLLAALLNAAHRLGQARP
ncbi:COX15/CtaA family protein [Sphingosinicella sp. LHD-64]|uniref:COX15/CtaA family protein n=1 Tax=Sphingosinicella sp. LHD-64 TaxID=3072139 RepID=UPI00280F684E|nr:COX15/CtaA family protein [Sphingosinicella sp. LHD-64]MDQ8755509.1 COX15/CtaA family protein [Sphingosinicella sp. LHD-64]